MQSMNDTSDLENFQDLFNFVTRCSITFQISNDIRINNKYLLGLFIPIAPHQKIHNLINTDGYNIIAGRY